MTIRRKVHCALVARRFEVPTAVRPLRLRAPAGWASSQFILRTRKRCLRRPAAARLRECSRLGGFAGQKSPGVASTASIRAILLGQPLQRRFSAATTAAAQRCEARPASRRRHGVRFRAAWHAVSAPVVFPCRVVASSVPRIGEHMSPGSRRGFAVRRAPRPPPRDQPEAVGAGALDQINGSCDTRITAPG